MEVNFLKQFLIDYNLKAVDVYSKTGQNKNTFTKWLKYENDAQLPQHFILSVLKEFPYVDLAKYFPTHAEIIKLSNERTVSL